LLVIAILSFGSATSIRISARPLEKVWRSDYRSQIQVYVCIETFSNLLPGLDSNLLRANIKNAMEVWNAYGGADFYFEWAGDLPGTGGQCAENAYPNSNGTVVVRAASCPPRGYRSAWALTETSWTGDYITKGFIQMHKYIHEGCDLELAWDFDHTNPDKMDVDTVLTHEFGHIVGFQDDNETPYTVMRQSNYSQERVLWPEDIFQLTNPSATLHYNRVTSRLIGRSRSSDLGLSWSAMAWLGTQTNNRLGFAYKPSDGAYLAAYRYSGPDQSVQDRVLTARIIGDTAYGVVHPYETLFGVTAAYGKGFFTIAWVDWDNDRHIWYRTSSDGLTWS